MSLGGHASGSEVEFDPTAAGWFNAGATAQVGGVVLAEGLDLWEFGEGVEFPVESPETAGGFGVFSEPGGPFLAGALELCPPLLKVAEGLVEVVHLGHDGRYIGRLGD